MGALAHAAVIPLCTRANEPEHRDDVLDPPAQTASSSLPGRFCYLPGLFAALPSNSMDTGFRIFLGSGPRREVGCSSDGGFT